MIANKVIRYKRNANAVSGLQKNRVPTCWDRSRLNPIGHGALTLADERSNGSLAPKSINDSSRIHQNFCKLKLKSIREFVKHKSRFTEL